MVEKSSSSNTSTKASQPKLTKGLSTASDSSMSSKVVEKKSSAKRAPSPEKRNLRDLQQQLIKLQEELKKEKEEKFEAMEELVLLRKDVSRNVANGSKSKIEIHQREAEKAKQSERKMLESLVSQTKQLERTKIALEEAKLEIRSLEERTKSLESSSTSGSQSSRNLGKHLLQYGFAGLVHAEDEITVLRNDLRLATEAEEKSRKAMDNLAIALKEVTTETNQVKERLLITQSELERVRAEAERLKSLLDITEDKFQTAFEESERLKLEIEESATIWNTKESSFINCIQMSEEEITKVAAENDKLFESQRVIRDENAKLRDMLKRAIADASDVKEALDIARNENAKLKDLLSVKDNSLRSIKQEYDCLKVSEAAATDSVKELKGLLAATSMADSNKNSSVPENEPFMEANDSRSDKELTKFTSERWNGNSPRFRARHRHSIGEAGKFSMAASPKPKDRMFASLSTISHLRSASSVIGDTDTLTSDDFDHMDAAHSEFGEQTPLKQRKKKNILRRLGEMLRRTSVHKQA